MTAVSMVSQVGRGFFALVAGGKTFLAHVARMAALVVSIFSRVPLIVKNVPISIEQMYGIGIDSLPLVSVIAIFIGATTVTQGVYQFSGFVPLKFLGLAVCKTLINEIGPVFTSMVVAGRIATAIAAEVGSMKTGEQLDAMQCLNLDPVRYLYMPKMIACMIMVPMLVIWSELIAFISSIFTVIFSVKMTLFVYINGLKFLFNPSDLILGVVKTSVFGAIIALTGCHFGLETRGGAEGVGNSTTKAVMTAFVLILVFDFVIAFIVW
ncbi:MAG TPA: ABC transporter permease [Chitinivibrionales bacterium]|nr:ABC transporter permease [Chitinivibrionales bacterium]